MAGHNTNKVTPTTTVFERTIPQPLDKWGNISSINNLTVELPLKIRYFGMLVYVEDISEYYYFKNGVENEHFTALRKDLSGVRIFDSIINTTKNQIFELEHSLDSNKLFVSFQHDNELLLNGWKLGKVDGSQKENYIHFSTTEDFTNLKVFIIAKNVTKDQSNKPNLDLIIEGILETLNTTNENFNNFQKISDFLSGSVRTVNGITPDENGNVETFTQTITDRINNFFYKNAVHTLSVEPKTFEKGVSTELVVSWNVQKNDDELVSCTLDGNDVTSQADGSTSTYEIVSVENTKDIILLSQVTRKGQTENINTKVTSKEIIPQYLGKMTTEEPSYTYSDLQNYTKYLQNESNKVITETYNNEYAFFLTKDQTPVLADGNDFILTVGDFTSETDFFKKKQVNVELENGDMQTMYLCRTREKVNATITFKIS